MKHKISHRKLSKTVSHKLAMFKNMTKSFFRYKFISTTKPKALSFISFISRFITKSLKKETDLDLLRYIQKNICGADKISSLEIFKIIKELKLLKLQSHYIKKRVLEFRRDSAIILKLSLNIIK